MSGPIGTAVSGLAFGIGLATEAYKHNKEKKSKSKVLRSPEHSEDDALPLAQFSDSPPSYDELSPLSEKGMLDIDEQAWELDDAQEELIDRPKSPEDKAVDSLKLTEAFIARYPAPVNPLHIDLPVIIPQRRPGNQSRGFVRAYAPVLSQAGIEQAEFLDFLKTLDKASRASPVFTVINAAAMVVGLVPGVITMSVSLAVGIIANIGSQIHSRHRKNTFMTKMNDEYFRPRGLYCLIMTYKPEADDSEVSHSVDLNATISSQLRIVGKRNKLKDRFKGSSGVTYGDPGFPEVAPLMYPELEKIAAGSDEEAVVKKNKLKRSKAFVEQYLDKRSQVKFANENPESVLASGPKPEFTSKLSDPSHPFNNGNPISFLTGGLLDPSSLREQYGGRGQDRQRGLLSRREIQSSRPGGRGLVGEILSLRQNTNSSRYEPRPSSSQAASESSRAAFEYETTPQGANSMGARRGSWRSFERGQWERRERDNPNRRDKETKGLKKLLRENVYYLVIVNMPSEEEMVAAQAQVEEAQRQRRAAGW